MERYLCLNLVVLSSDQSDELVAFLSQYGFDGFEELPGCLKAYRTENGWEEEAVLSYLKSHSFSFSVEYIEKTNWNQLWESNFDPVVVDDFLGIRARFHAPILQVEHELIITPKMSFGTGHHATTRLMVKMMRGLVRPGDQVLDFGTGTGVLAILAKKMGAEEVLGIDIEDWSIENAMENAAINEVTGIQFQCADAINVSATYDLMLANINLNVLLEHMGDISQCLRPSGTLLLSGILIGDLAQMDKALEKAGLMRSGLLEESGWISIQAVKNQ
jgi:ribosomal protein L11 methyltransferase